MTAIMTAVMTAIMTAVMTAISPAESTEASYRFLLQSLLDVYLTSGVLQTFATP